MGVLAGLSESHNEDDHIMLDKLLTASSTSTQNMENPPKSANEAWNGPEKEFWRPAMMSEFQSLTDNNTHTLVPTPKSCKLIGTKWVFKKKITASGTMRCKARLVEWNTKSPQTHQATQKRRVNARDCTLLELPQDAPGARAEKQLTCVLQRAGSRTQCDLELICDSGQVAAGQGKRSGDRRRVN